MKIVSKFILFICLSGFLAAAEKQKFDESKPLMAYDGMKEPWKEKACADWIKYHERLEQRLEKKIVVTKNDTPVKIKKLKAGIKVDLERIRENDPVYFPQINTSTLQKDDWGIIADGEHGSERFFSIKVLQVISPSRLLCKLGDKTFIIDGIDTSDVTDDTSFQTKTIFYVVGTESYQTVLGAKKTVHVLKSLKFK